MRRCKKCGLDKPLTEFYRNARKKDGRGTTCRHCLKRREICDYCGRSTSEYRRSQDGGFECRLERKCIAPRQPNHGKLTRLGAAVVVGIWKQCRYSQRDTAAVLGVVQSAISHFLRIHAPEALRMARERRLMRLNNNAHKAVHVDRAALCRALRCHGYRVAPAARELGHCERWMRKELRRVAPDVYARLPELRRAA